MTAVITQAHFVSTRNISAVQSKLTAISNDNDHIGVLVGNVVSVGA
ncbi:hypothetical protein I6F33_32810 [Bradyrhizobium sp. BRP20]|nr:hypothetical protein [Bradyrhizobium sp. BRP20]MCA1437710.1 hypothetical protein [Bradyrhizobium sp. BRP20]